MILQLLNIIKALLNIFFTILFSSIYKRTTNENTSNASLYSNNINFLLTFLAYNYKNKCALLCLEELIILCFTLIEKKSDVLIKRPCFNDFLEYFLKKTQEYQNHLKMEVLTKYLIKCDSSPFLLPT